MKSNMADKGEEAVDLFRDTWMRYLGYANEIGEAFKSHIPKASYLGCYLVASCYAFGDAISKTMAMKKTTENFSNEVRWRSSTEAFVKALTWQSLASVAIPGFTINRICVATGIFLSCYVSHIPLAKRAWITTAVGLVAIPFIIKPIDRSVDFIMEEMTTITQHFGWKHNKDHDG
ncbi:mitochondrial fission process protein 1-like [Xenia sp. Carnegie-2017]|uniref:mitochondrial fission process protein 1-like n=1 Tax=Xenia sp. Carnegie-2017 TaxID=2897299 RepID=UPI001F04392B|nr:mitochondrial fission process protein 1-like [Xenia sp. Carnegie-2017]